MNLDKTPVSPPGNVTGSPCCDRQTLTETAWHSLSEDRVYSLLASSSYGLTAEEVGTRIQKFGSNTLPSKQTRGTLGSHHSPV